MKQASSESYPGLNLLLVMDHREDACLIEALARDVKQTKLSLEVVNNVETALGRLEEGGIDLILLDLDLTGNQGLESFFTLTAQNLDIPIIMVAGLDSANLAMEAIREGAQDYLIKEKLDSQLLIRSVKYALEQFNNRDELNKKSLEREINEESLHTIIEKNADGMLIVDQDGIVLFLNPAAEKILNRKSVDLLGNMIGLPIISGESTEIAVNRSDGKHVVVEARTVNTVWKNKEVSLISLRDISKLKRMQRKIQKANRKLEGRVNERTAELKKLNQELLNQQKKLKQSNTDLKKKSEELELGSRYKSEFLANMSHELRTPLNSLLIFAQLLTGNKGGNLTDKQVKFASDIHSSGTELLDLINDILDLSKIEAGKMDLYPEDVYISDVSEYVQRTFEPMIDKRGLSLDVQTDANLPSAVGTDRQKLHQILKNLLSNAVKFTEHGGIQVRIFRPDSGTAGISHLNLDQTLAFSVTDTGAGIPLDKQKLIFEAFQQVDGSISRQYGGTGLGLSICRQLVRLLQGEIHLESQEGEGSTFTLYLPLQLTGVETEASTSFTVSEPSEIPPPAGNPPPDDFHHLPPEKNSPEPLIGEVKPSHDVGSAAFIDQKQEGLFKGKQILLADIDMRSVYSLMAVLEANGMQIHAAANGQDALDSLDTYPEIDLVLMAFNMPIMDGYQALKRIRQQEKYAELPIIALIADAREGDREKYIQAGANDYLAKPINTEKLFSLLRVWLYS
jgi:signal transduction histidine kinase/DNA-binding response OmpR family regulator